MASTQQANHLTNRKRKATDMEQHQKNRPRQTSEMQSFPFLKFYDRLQQLPFSHPSQLLSSASGNNKNGLMAAGAQQEERGSRVDRPRRDGTVFDFARLRSHAFGSQNPTGDATDDDGSAVPRQYASSGTSNVPHNMFGEEDYFKDLGAFFNATDEQAVHHGPANIIPPSAAAGDMASLLHLSAASGADHGENRHLVSKESQQAPPPPPRSKESRASQQKTTTSQPKKKKTSSQTLKSADGAAKKQNESLLPVGGEEDRVMKNIREKKRRKGVSEKFKELYTLVCANTKKTADVGAVPPVKTGRVSKARMLDETINLIKNMECECSSLHARNRFLEYQLRQFQHMPQEGAALAAKAATIVTPPIMPFGTQTVNPFLYVKMASLPSGQLASRRQ